MPIALQDDQDQEAQKEINESGFDIQAAKARQAEVDNLNNLYSSDSATEEDRKKGLKSDSSLLDKEKSASLADDFGFKADSKPNNSTFQNLKGLALSFKNGGMSGGKKAGIVAGGFALSAILIAIIAFISTFTHLKFDLTMRNIERKAFMRYQVAMENRSTKWINAYMTVRMLEIDDKNPTNKDGNLFFRSDRVDTNNPFTDWYKTKRTSKFETDLLEKHGIKFTSIATRQNGMVVFRPGFVDYNNTKVPLNVNISDSDLQAIYSGDINKLNEVSSRLGISLESGEFANDKAARRAIKKAVDDETKFWQVLKRRHVRKNIQNMIGVRDWRFFETTRNKLDEKKIEVRNKIISKSLPSDTKMSAFVKCMFGVEMCGGSKDPIDKSVRDNNFSSTGAKEGSQTFEGPDNKPVSGAGGGSEDPADAINSARKEALSASTADLANGMRGFMMKRLIPGLNIVQWVDSIARIDGSIKSGSLQKMVAVAKASSYIGFYATYATAWDQKKTGQVTAEEFSDFAETINSVSNSEGWVSAIDPKSNQASAETQNIIQAKDKTEYCSNEYQEKLRLPSNKYIADQQFAYNCNPIGGKTGPGVLSIADWWEENISNSAIGSVISVYRGSVGKIVNVVNNLIGFVLDPIMNATMSLAKQIPGVSEGMDGLVGWAMTKVSSMVGIPPYDQTDPSPVNGMSLIMGAGATQETSIRYQGGAITTPESKKVSEDNILAYQKELKNNSSIYDRYISTENPESSFSKSAFAVSDGTSGSNMATLITKSFGLVKNSAFGIFTQNTSAATEDSYAVSKFAGIETYDWPKQCYELDPLTMTPQMVTNATTVGWHNEKVGTNTVRVSGWLKNDELTWDLVNNNTSFYDKLYERIKEQVSETEGLDGKFPDDYASEIYNCALMDTAVRGGLGALDGYTDDNGLNDTQSTVSSTDGQTGAPINSRFGPFVFPIQATQDEIKNYKPLSWCWDDTEKTCHSTEGFGYYASDIFVKPGTPILSATNGKVVKVGTADAEYGQSITIKGNDCEDGKLTCMGQGSLFYYTHMKPGSQLVKVGDEVSAGQQIGVSGTAEDTGNVSTEHLHFDVSDRHNQFRGFCQRSNPSACAEDKLINVQKELHDSFMSIGSVETINTTNEGWVWPYNESASVRSGPCYGGSSLHAGIDINFTSPGVSAIAAHDGKVVRVSPNSGAAGNFVMIKINDNLYYNYQHLNSISVNEGDVVKAGSTIIGEVGTTGNTEVSANTKGHLHFGVSTSQDFGSYGNVASSKDPLNYLPSGAPGGYVCN